MKTIEYALHSNNMCLVR